MLQASSQDASWTHANPIPENMAIQTHLYTDGWTAPDRHNKVTLTNTC